MPLRVVLADDHVLVRESVKSLLEGGGYHVVGEAADGQEALRQTESQRPDMVVIDVAMPLLNGLEVARLIKRSFPKIKTIVLTQHDTAQYVGEALDAGVKGYVVKTQAARDLLEALRQVSRGDVYLGRPGISHVALRAHRTKSMKASDLLTSRQQQVLRLIAEGKSTSGVASILGIAKKTAESHRSRLMQKLDIHDTATLVRYAIRRGLVKA